MRENIPDQIAPEIDATLRANIKRCCTTFLIGCQALRDGGVTADAVRARGKEQSPLERLAKSLRKAADAWADISSNVPRPEYAAWLELVHAERRILEVGPYEDHDFRWPYEIGMSPTEAVDLAVKLSASASESAREHLFSEAAHQKGFEGFERRKYGKIYDDRLGDIRQYEQLEALARDAERRLNSLRRLKPIRLTTRPEMVLAVKQCLVDAGLNPTVTKRVYPSADGIEPTWFQKFMAALNDNLLGNDGWGLLEGTARLPAFYSEIAELSKPR
jgi:hypothetical protein